MRVSLPARGGRAARLLLASALTAAAVLAAHPSADAQRPAGTRTVVATVDTAAARTAATKAKQVKIKVGRAFYGVHDAHLTSLARSSTGGIRLWDAGVTWADLQPTADGGYNWTRLDQIVSDAHRNKTEVTLVLARTPAWAAATPDHALPTDPPSLDAWRSYVTAVMEHYAPANWGYRGIANYQVWNEPNITTFWTGTREQMAGLVQVASQVRAAVDPGARLVSPSLVIRLGYQQTWVSKFYRLKVGGKAVWRYVDAAAFSSYPVDTYPVNPSKPKGATRPATPEDSMRLLQQVRAILAADKVSRSLPVWNTEINYGMHTGELGGHAATPISDALQIAYVLRTYVLNAAAGVKRVDWYAYDMGNLSAAYGGGPLGNTLLTDPSQQSAGVLTPAGRAFTRVQGWLGGTLLGSGGHAPCRADSHGTYTCQVRYSASRTGRIYWNPYRTGKVHLVASAKRRTDEYGHSSKVRGGATLKVGARPVLVTSTR